MRENNEIGFFGGVIRGALVTVITALIGVLVFAFILTKLKPAGDN